MVMSTSSSSAFPRVLYYQEEALSGCRVAAPASRKMNPNARAPPGTPLRLQSYTDGDRALEVLHEISLSAERDHHGSDRPQRMREDDLLNLAGAMDFPTTGMC